MDDLHMWDENEVAGPRVRLQDGRCGRITSANPADGSCTVTCYPFFFGSNVQGDTLALLDGADNVEWDFQRIVSWDPERADYLTVLRESKIIPGLRMWMIVAMVGLVCSDQLS